MLKSFVRAIVLLALVLTIVCLLVGDMMQRESLRVFIEKTHYGVSYTYPGMKTPGTRNIVLRGERPFIALVADQRFHVYGQVESNELSEAVISVYIGSDLTTFQFLMDRDQEQNPVKVTSSENDQKLEATLVCRPIWWRLQKAFGYTMEEETKEEEPKSYMLPPSTEKDPKKFSMKRDNKKK